MSVRDPPRGDKSKHVLAGDRATTAMRAFRRQFLGVGSSGRSEARAGHRAWGCAEGSTGDGFWKFGARISEGPWGGRSRKLAAKQVMNLVRAGM
jgi:hypothetical protein